MSEGLAEGRAKQHTISIACLPDCKCQRVQTAPMPIVEGKSAQYVELYYFTMNA